VHAATKRFEVWLRGLFAAAISAAAGRSHHGNAGYYIPVQGTALNNWKLNIIAAGGAETSAGAYPAGVTGDIVQLSITAKKLL
jgi:hypothetical protein